MGFKKILVGFAFSPNLKANIFEAIRMTSLFNGELMFLHVGEKTKEKMARFNELVDSNPIKIKKLSVHWKRGDAVSTLLNSCKEFKADLIVLGALKRENVLKFYMGSIARKITRKAKCSVLLLINPSIEIRSCNHIVVNGFDSPKTGKTIEMAFKVAKAFSTKKITLVEEISKSKIAVNIDDDQSLRRATLKKQKLSRQENIRVADFVKGMPINLTKKLNWVTQSIF